VYSVKISELLIRTVVEIESIVKELYLIVGGAIINNKDLYFDTDCIQLLEEKWILSKKKVFVSAFNFYLSNEVNRILTPFKKANKRGSSSSEWQKAYQAVKHNRVQNLNKGNLKNLINSLAALYLVNVYYKDTIFESISDSTGTNLDASMGSSIYSIKFHQDNGISPNSEYNKMEDFDECTYLIKATDFIRKEFQKSMKLFYDDYNEKFAQNTKTITEKLANKEGIVENVDVYLIFQKITAITLPQVNNEIARNFKNSSDNLKYEAVINKQQF
jgi:hypothetical protein